MRKLTLFGPITLAACATAPTGTPIHGETPGHTCNAAAAEQFIGQPGTSETGAAIMRATKAAILRWAPPDTMLTMDFREDRATVFLGSDGKITKIQCV